MGTPRQLAGERRFTRTDEFGDSRYAALGSAALFVSRAFRRREDLRFAEIDPASLQRARDSWEGRGARRPSGERSGGEAFASPSLLQ